MANELRIVEKLLGVILEEYYPEGIHFEVIIDTLDDANVMYPLHDDVGTLMAYRGFVAAEMERMVKLAMAKFVSEH